ncbi:MAG: helix-turn-helix transcriptional regulator [Phycisphaerales bacterium]|nr:helix-turn-helix transcriptional regulator [Phycisphaerales bacterium]
MISETNGDENLLIADDFLRFETGLINLGPLDSLSRRELEVLALISQGLTTDEIAKDLHRSAKTIEAHRSSIARKLGVKNRVQLAELARKAALEIRHADLKRVAVSP